MTRSEKLRIFAFFLLVATGFVIIYHDARGDAERRARAEMTAQENARLESQVNALKAEALFHREIISSQNQDMVLTRAEATACEEREGQHLLQLGDAHDQIGFLRERLLVRSADLEAVLARLRTREADYNCALEALDGTPDPRCWKPEIAHEGP